MEYHGSLTLVLLVVLVFFFTAVQDDGTGKSRFDVYYNGKRIFEANPENGKIYFGDNFWYDPADASIHTPNDKTVINADGIIIGQESNFSESIVNGMNLKFVYGSSSTAGASSPFFSFTLLEDISYDAEVILNLISRIDYGIDEPFNHCIGGILSSSNMISCAQIEQYWSAFPKDITFNRNPCCIFLSDNGDSYDLKCGVYGFSSPIVRVLEGIGGTIPASADWYIQSIFVSGLIAIV